MCVPCEGFVGIAQGLRFCPSTLPEILEETNEIIRHSLQGGKPGCFGLLSPCLLALGVSHANVTEPQFLLWKETGNYFSLGDYTETL